LDNLLYEDKPRSSPTSYFGLLTKPLPSMQMWPIVLVYLAALILVFTQPWQSVIDLIFIILAATFLLTFIEIGTLATRYQIFNDRIRIVLGWIFHFDIHFSNLENTREATSKDLWRLNLNFTYFPSGDDILQITRKRGARIYINPSNRKLFLENLNNAITDWRKYNPGY
jgi:hypothetical protein